MVSESTWRVHGEYMESTWRVHGSLLLILIRNYNGFLVDMDLFRSSESSFEQGITMVSWIHGSFKFADSLPKRSQIGIRCSGTKKYSQRFEIGHFCPGTFSALQSSKNWYESNRGTFRFTIPISDIPVTPSFSLRSYWNRRLVCSEYRFRNLWFKHRGIQFS